MLYCIFSTTCAKKNAITDHLSRAENQYVWMAALPTDIRSNDSVGSFCPPTPQAALSKGSHRYVFEQWSGLFVVM